MKTCETSRRFLGITVLGDFIINEGVEGVLDNVVGRAGATAVGLNPTVTAPAEEGSGTFQPPTDACSSPRLFDRPLWGKRALWVRSGPSYHPNPSCYAGSPYPPIEPNDLTESQGPVIGEFIRKARERGLKVYLQLKGATPPGLREGDVPRLPDGRIPVGRMANTGSLASEAIRSYNRALVRDLLEHYPDVTGVRPDWPEYPCYKLDEAFQDFGPHVRDWAAERGCDFEGIRREVGAFYNHLHGGLTDDDLRDFASAGRGTFSQLNLLRRYPGVLAWLRLKADLSHDLLHAWRDALTEYGGGDRELSANAFMPPFSLFTGFDFARAGHVCTAVSPKLYAMHWTVMVQFWGQVLLDAIP